MTVVSFATSAPELIVSLNATLDGLPNFAIGNVLGSNIANIGLVLGIITIIYPISLKQRFYKTDFPLLIMSTVLFYYVITLKVKFQGLRANSSYSNNINIILFIFLSKNDHSEFSRILIKIKFQFLNRFFYTV